MAFKKYNINPKGKKTGDCAIRAVAAATGLGWDAAYKGLSEAGFALKTAMNDAEAIEFFLVNVLGWHVGTIPRGTKKPRVDQFAEEHPDWYAVLRVSHHITCSGQGNYIDIWDCGDSHVYKYWYIERDKLNQTFPK